MKEGHKFDNKEAKMKRALYFLIGLNIVGGGKAFADNSLTGLHLGFGLNVVADEYKSDVDVLGKVEYASGGEKWTFEGPKFDQLLVDERPASHSVHWDGAVAEYYNHSATTDDGYTVTYTEDFYPTKIVDKSNNSVIIESGFPITIVDSNGIKRKFEFICDVATNPDEYDSETGKSKPKTHNCIMKDITENTAFSDDLHADLITSITSGESPVANIYGDQLPQEINRSGTSEGTSTSYLSAAKHQKARTNRVGGELKMSYFHNLTDYLALGVDICGTLNQKARKNIGINKLNYAEQPVTEITSSGYQISYNADGTQFAKYVGDKFTEKSIGEITSEGKKVEGFFNAETKGDGSEFIPPRTYTITSEGSESTVDLSGIINDNPGYKEFPEGQQPDIAQYLQISSEKGGDVTFEKNKFNSRAAVVLGAQYKGWFAGIRGGVSYNQGKIHAKDITGTSTEDVSFASPFVGVHLMKNINMKGLENGHIYVTADVNVQNKQNLKMKGIKNFRQNSVNVSLGMTWQIN